VLHTTEKQAAKFLSETPPPHRFSKAKTRRSASDCHSWCSA